MGAVLASTTSWRSANPRVMSLGGGVGGVGGGGGGGGGSIPSFPSSLHRRNSYRRANTSLALTSAAAAAGLGLGGGGGGGGTYHDRLGGAMAASAAYDGDGRSAILNGLSSSSSAAAAAGVGGVGSSKWSYQPPPAPPPPLPATGSIHEQVKIQMLSEIYIIFEKVNKKNCLLTLLLKLKRCQSWLQHIHTLKLSSSDTFFCIYIKYESALTCSTRKVARLPEDFVAVPADAQVLLPGQPEQARVLRPPGRLPVLPVLRPGGPLDRRRRRRLRRRQQAHPHLRLGPGQQRLPEPPAAVGEQRGRGQARSALECQLSWCSRLTQPTMLSY